MIPLDISCTCAPTVWTNRCNARSQASFDWQERDTAASRSVCNHHDWQPTDWRLLDPANIIVCASNLGQHLGMTSSCPDHSKLAGPEWHSWTFSWRVKCGIRGTAEATTFQLWNRMPAMRPPFRNNIWPDRPPTSEANLETPNPSMQPFLRGMKYAIPSSTDAARPFEPATKPCGGSN